MKEDNFSGLHWKTGDGWKACFDERTGKYTAKLSGPGYCHLYELTEELFDQLADGMSDVDLNQKASYPNPYLMIRVKGNRGFWFGGIHCGYDRATALAVSGDELESYDGGKTFRIGDGVYAGIKIVPTYDKNDVITEMLLTVSPSG